ncbi:MAG TPA: hypothetical protein VK045_11780 [Ornithinicoccus sp.]|jgi:hypothetical protein|nr:hypothetical protein [Ornithinicoccus sp.]
MGRLLDWALKAGLAQVDPAPEPGLPPREQPDPNANRPKGENR